MAAIELFLPAGATVAAVQDDAVVPHCPAFAGRGELDGIEIGTDRDAGLGPAFALVVGVQDMATLPHGYQPRTRLRQIEQGAAYCQLAALRRKVEHIHQRRGATAASRQGQAQGDELERKHRDVL
ncbi:hypothetical protein D3C84_1014530 [compost metagenome]